MKLFRRKSRSGSSLVGYDSKPGKSNRLLGSPPIAVLLILVIGLTAWIGTRLYGFSTEILMPPHHSVAEAPADWGLRNPLAYQLPYEEVTIRSDDGTKLSGWFIPSAITPAKAGIVLVHGRSTNRVFMLPLAPGLHAAGFDLLLFDLRRHGESGGAFSTMGVKESDDVIAASRWLRYQTPSQKIGVVGVSMGAAATLMAACRSQDIRAVAAETPFTSAADILTYQARVKYNLPRWPVVPLAIGIASLRAGVNLTELSPIACVAKIAPRPILFIGVTNDETVPRDHIQKLFSAAGEPKTLWIMPAEKHAITRPKLPADYIPRIVNFMNRSLGTH